MAGDKPFVPVGFYSAMCGHDTTLQNGKERVVPNFEEMVADLVQQAKQGINVEQPPTVSRTPLDAGAVPFDPWVCPEIAPEGLPSTQKHLQARSKQGPLICISFTT